MSSAAIPCAFSHRSIGSRTYVSVKSSWLGAGKCAQQGGQRKGFLAMADIESLSHELHWIPGLNSDEYTKMMRDKAAAEKALDRAHRRKPFDDTAKDTGVLHDVPSVAKALAKW